MKATAIILLSVVLTAEALPSALIQSPMARSDRDKPIDTVGEGLKDPKVAEAVILLAYLEKVAEAAALGAIGATVDAQGRSIESEDRKSNDAENRNMFSDWFKSGYAMVGCAISDLSNFRKCL